MSDCRCSGSTTKDWDGHSDYCPVYMQGRIKELEAALAEAADRIEICGYPKRAAALLAIADKEQEHA